MPFKKRSNKTEPPKYKAGDRVSRATGLPRQGTVLKRIKDLEYNNGRKHKQFLVKWDNSSHPEEIVTQRLRLIKSQNPDGQTQKEDIQSKI
tara:strand:+ start:257 stop:529 length:273 start_codon:yes stop_codon:yes gene_type:complete